MKILIAMALCICAGAADEQKWFKITAVDSSLVDRSFQTENVTAAQSKTNCSTMFGVTNCSTTAKPATHSTSTTERWDVTMYAETETERLKLTCTTGGFSWCKELPTGRTFEAKRDGVKLLVKFRPGGNLDKELTVKFRIVDIQPKPDKPDLSASPSSVPSLPRP